MFPRMIRLKESGLLTSKFARLIMLSPKSKNEAPSSDHIFFGKDREREEKTVEI